METEKTLWWKDLAQKGTNFFILQLVFPHIDSDSPKVPEDRRDFGQLGQKSGKIELDFRAIRAEKKQ